jgi:hypothetical protein
VLARSFIHPWKAKNFTQKEKTDDPDKKQAITEEHAKLLEMTQGGMSRGLKLALTSNPSKIPESLEAELSGQKEYGWYLNESGELEDLGEGENFNFHYTIRNLEKIVPVIREIKELGAILDIEKKIGMGLDVDEQLLIGPTRIYSKFMQLINEIRNDAEYWVTKEVGTGSQDASGLGLGKVVKVEVGDELKTDHVINFIIEKGIFKDGRKYILQDYSYPSFPEPTRGELKNILDQIETTVKEQVEASSAFHAKVDNGSDMKGSEGSSQLIFNAPADYDSTDGPLSFDFIKRNGPFQPYHYKPGDIIGSADKPHYGIGGFHEFYPPRLELTAPATLILDYDNEEVEGIDELTLAIYRFDYDTRQWVYIGGERDVDANTVTAEITRLGAYTLGPAMPAGTVEWEDVQVQQVGDSIRLSISSQMLLMNNGEPVPDGTIFHALSALPYSFGAEGPITFGSILSDDFLPDVEGHQVSAENGRVHLELEIPSGLSQGVRVIIFSDTGTSFGSNILS